MKSVANVTIASCSRRAIMYTPGVIIGTQSCSTDAVNAILPSQCKYYSMTMYSLPKDPITETKTKQRNEIPVPKE